mmetsp:Transcript_32409/g.64287  ORF Transcript_32409/g.64287 Transcript_32409/m.64287 type:complete len:126 (+) Transcript_32409:364-741(+)
MPALRHVTCPTTTDTSALGVHADAVVKAVETVVMLPFFVPLAAIIARLFNDPVELRIGERMGFMVGQICGSRSLGSVVDEAVRKSPEVAEATVGGDVRANFLDASQGADALHHVTHSARRSRVFQ